MKPYRLGSITGLALVATSLGVVGATPASAEPVLTGELFASDLAWASATNGWGPVEKDRSNGEQAAGDGRTLKIAGKSYAKGLGVHADSAVRYDLGGSCERFVSDIGIDDESWGYGTVMFSVVADDVVVAQSPVLTGNSPVARIDAHIDGAQHVDLVVSSAGDNFDLDHADWGDAKFSCSGDGTAAATATLTAPTTTVYASDLAEIASENGFGPAEKDMSNGELAAGDGTVLNINGTKYAKGLGVHANSRLRYYTGGNCTSFTAKAGIDEEVGGDGSVNFRVFADGYQVYSSGKLTGWSSTRSVSATITGARIVELVVDDAGDGIGRDHADWADAKFTCTAGPGQTFYSTPASLPPANGDVVRSEPSEFWLSPLKITKVDAKVTRMMYRTTDRTGQPIAVTGQLIVPNKTWSGSGPRPVIGYSAGTQGLGDKCAPSYQTTVGTEYEAPFILGLLTRGYAVAMTDYQGLGTAGEHTYMVREATGRAVLDGIRAALNLPNTGLSKTAPIALSGYSQGGGATAAAAELAASYAPELNVVAATPGGTPGELRVVAENLERSLYVAFLGYAVNGIDSAYNTGLAGILNEKGTTWMAKLRQQCTFESVLTTMFTDTSTLTKDGRSVLAYMNEEPWSSAVDDQRMGNGRRPTVPTLVTHSRLDEVVPFEAGHGTAVRWCSQGAPVRFKANIAPGHVAGAVVSYLEAFAFLEDRFAGKAFTSNCGSF